MTASALPGQSPRARRPLGGGTRSALRFGAVLPAILLAVFAVGGCSSGGSSPASTGVATSPSTAVAPSGAPGPGGNGGGQLGAAFQAYSDCLKKNGVTLPSFTPRDRSSGQPSPDRPHAPAAPGSAVAWVAASAPRVHPRPASAPTRGPRRSRRAPPCDRRSLPARAGPVEPAGSTRRRWRRTCPASRTTASRSREPASVPCGPSTAVTRPSPRRSRRARHSCHRAVQRRHRAPAPPPELKPEP